MLEVLYLKIEKRLSEQINMNIKMYNRKNNYYQILIFWNMKKNEKCVINKKFNKYEYIFKL